MNREKGVLLASAKGELPSSSGGTGVSKSPLLVVCHGMFLFEVAKDDHGDHQLFVHAPKVPAMPGMEGKPGDPGHVYLANSRRSADGAEELGDTGKTYKLVGPAPLLITHMAPDLAGSTSKWHNESNLMLPSASYRRSTITPAYTVVMPLPDAYWGWRSTSPLRSNNGASLCSPYTAAHLVTPVLPWSVFSTHVFRYSGGASLALNRKGESEPVWQSDSSSPIVLHLFSQPKSLKDALELAKKGVKMDHIQHLNDLVYPNPGVASAHEDYLAEMEQPRVPWGLHRDDLLDLGESETTDPARPLDAKEPCRACRTVNGQKIACGAYFLNSSQTEH